MYQSCAYVCTSILLSKLLIYVNPVSCFLSMFFSFTVIFINWNNNCAKKVALLVSHCSRCCLLLCNCFGVLLRGWNNWRGEGGELTGITGKGT